MNAGGRLADHRAARPLLIGQLQERHDRFDACVVNEDVDRSELVPDSVDHRLDVRTVGDVPLDRDRPAPGGEERLNDVFSLDEIVHRDIGALRGEYLGDAATRSCYLRDFAFESHKTSFMVGRLRDDRLIQLTLALLKERDDDALDDLLEVWRVAMGVERGLVGIMLVE